MKKKSIQALSAQEIDGKTVLVRCDFNVPISDNVIQDKARIHEALPTIRALREKGAKLILCSHLGRPGGEVIEELRLNLIRDELEKALNTPVKKSNDCVGPEVEKAAQDLEKGEILLLENLRFHKAETENNRDFAKALASLADLFVLDAFGTAHRAHASTAGVAEFIPAVSGLLVEKELQFLHNALNNPKRPFLAIVGGAKVSSKLKVLEKLLGTVDTLVIGGGMIFTFMKAQGLEIGSSLCEDTELDAAKAFLAAAEQSSTTVLFPEDQIVATAFSNDAERKEVDSTAIPSDMMGLDIGPKTISRITPIINEANTILWNGPLGVFEMENFAKGTFAIAHAIAGSAATSIIGGGDSALAVKRAGVEAEITHISTGGGASLEFLEGKPLPGIMALEDSSE